MRSNGAGSPVGALYSLAENWNVGLSRFHARVSETTYRPGNLLRIHSVVFVLTDGGPIYYTQVLSLWAYRVGIEGGSLAQGAAIALFLLPLLLGVTILVLRAARRIEVN